MTVSGGSGAGIPGSLLQSPHPVSQARTAAPGRWAEVGVCGTQPWLGRGGRGVANTSPPHCPGLIRNTRASRSFPYQTLEGDRHSGTDDLTDNHNCILPLTSGPRRLTPAEHLPYCRNGPCLPQLVRTQVYEGTHCYDPHLTDKKTEVGRGEQALLRSLRRQSQDADPGCGPRALRRMSARTLTSSALLEPLYARARGPVAASGPQRRLTPAQLSFPPVGVDRNEPPVVQSWVLPSGLPEVGRGEPWMGSSGNLSYSFLCVCRALSQQRWGQAEAKWLLALCPEGAQMPVGGRPQAHGPLGCGRGCSCPCLAVQRSMDLTQAMPCSANSEQCGGQSPVLGSWAGASPQLRRWPAV